jgi:hypothetical protein
VIVADLDQRRGGEGLPFPLQEQVISPGFSPSLACGPPGDFLAGSPSRPFYPLASQVRKSCDQETLKHNPHKKAKASYTVGRLTTFGPGGF